MRVHGPILVALALAGFGVSRLAAATTFTEDVVPILKSHCIACHRDGQMAPMALTRYDEVRPWAKSIRREVAARRMPPFNVSGEIGRYVDDPRLSEQEIDAMIAWIDGDMPKGPGGDSIDTAPFERDSEWETGEPDLLVEFPQVSIPGGIGDAYLLLYGEPVFDEAVWIDAVEWSIGNSKIVHHIIPKFVDADAPVPANGTSPVVNMDVESRVKGFGAGYLPGSGPYVLASDEALLIPARTRLVAEVHYAAAELAESDLTRVGIRFAEGFRRPALPLFHVPVRRIAIEPGDPSYTRVETMQVTEHLLARSFRFHMHLRGKSGRLDVLYPDGREELLIEVPDYDFNWQNTYELKLPVLLPAGSEVTLTAVWDNSAQNPRNPDPTARIRTGVTTKDEMGSASIFVSREEPTDAKVFLANGQPAEPPPYVSSDASVEPTRENELGQL